MDAAIQDVAGYVTFTWMLQFKMLGVLLFGVEFSYKSNFFTFTTSSLAYVGLGFVFHIHFQSSNIYILRFLHFEIHWDLVLFFFSFSRNLLKSVVGIKIWFWNVFVEFEFQIQEILKF